MPDDHKNRIIPEPSLMNLVMRGVIVIGLAFLAAPFILALHGSSH